jgi:hypothetical protein
MSKWQPLLALAILTPALAPAAPPERPRLVVLTDIGGDPDDTQSLIRLLVYANEFDIEGLIASASGTPGELKQEVTRPDLIRGTVEAYGKVRDNLLKHAHGYPPADELLARVKSGNPKRGSKHVGDGHDTDGSNWIIKVVDRDDPRPVNVAIWGGQTDLAQALWRVRNDRTPGELKAFVGKLRVHDIDDQDGLQGWITGNFPDLFYVLSKSRPGEDKRTGAYRGMYLGGDESLTSREWIDAHIRTGRGPLGALYPTRTWTAPNPHSALKEGDTPSWFYFLPTGLSDPAHPEWGGWGGRFRHAGGRLYRDAADTVGTVTDSRATVWRWRPAFQADFQARMDWCVKPARGSNHPPTAGFRGDTSRQAVRLTAKPGERVTLAANGSADPDGDRLRFRWWVYREAGTYPGEVAVEDATVAETALQIPSDAAGRTIHIILEVTDSGTPPLTRYRRVVVEVTKAE